MKKSIEAEKRNIMSSISGIHRHTDRITALETAGYTTDRVAMGSGGIGQVRHFSTKNAR